jgi:hypothetical protein
MSVFLNLESFEYKLSGKGKYFLNKSKKKIVLGNFFAAL